MALEASLRGTTSARYRDLDTQKKLLEQSLRSRIRNSTPNPDKLMLPTQTLPALAAEYFRLEGAFAIRMGVYKFLVQQAEFLKLEASKSIKVVSVIDPPWVNDKRISPKRRIVVQSVFVLSFIASVSLVVLAAAWRSYRKDNPQSEVMLRDIKRGLWFH
jgi:hypothetical protein